MTIYVQIVPENCLKTLPLWFLFITGKAFHGEETNQVEVLEANQCSTKSFFSSFSTKRKLIEDSFELSGSHLCLKTVHLALH